MNTEHRFDENNIVLSFAAISDIHITAGEDDSEAKFRTALRELKAKAGARGLDAILAVGDIINSREEKQIYKYKEIYETECVPFIPMIYCLGDAHDLLWMDKNVRDSVMRFADIFGEKYFETDINPELIPCGNRHCVICGHHIIALQPIHRMTIYYGDKTKAWLDSTLAEITGKEPEKHVFIITHPMLHNTCYGSTLGDQWDTADLTSVLSKYPQVVTFGGHLHFPLNDERSIMQKSFTSLGCGSVRYMAIDDGFMREWGYVMYDAYRFSQGLLVSVDINDNVRFTRLDFENGAEIKSPWTIGNSLDSFRPERAEAATSPVFPENASVTLSQGKNSGGHMTCFMGFPAAHDGDMVHHYIISISDGAGNEIISKSLLSDFYRFPNPFEMAENISVDIGDLGSGEYKIAITAVNSWDKKSAPLVRTTKYARTFL